MDSLQAPIPASLPIVVPVQAVDPEGRQTVIYILENETDEYIEDGITFEFDGEFDN